MRVLRALVLVLLAAAVFGCSVDRPSPDPVTKSYPTDERPLDSLALIERAVETGLLDYSTGILYKVYAVFNPTSLPPEYESDVLIKCGTPLIVEVQRNWNRIFPEHRSEIEMYIMPLTEPETGDTELDDVTPDRLEHERNRLD